MALKAFARLMVNDHVGIESRLAALANHANDVKKFSTIETSSQNEGVKRFAAEALPILQQHAQLAKAIKSKL